MSKSKQEQVDTSFKNAVSNEQWKEVENLLNSEVKSSTEVLLEITKNQELNSKLSRAPASIIVGLCKMKENLNYAPLILENAIRSKQEDITRSEEQLKNLENKYGEIDKRYQEILNLVDKEGRVKKESTLWKEHINHLRSVNASIKQYGKNNTEEQLEFQRLGSKKGLFVTDPEGKGRLDDQEFQEYRRLFRIINPGDALGLEYPVLKGIREDLSTQLSKIKDELKPIKEDLESLTVFQLLRQKEEEQHKQQEEEQLKLIEELKKQFEEIKKREEQDKQVDQSPGVQAIIELLVQPEGIAQLNERLQKELDVVNKEIEKIIPSDQPNPEKIQPTQEEQLRQKERVHNILEQLTQPEGKNNLIKELEEQKEILSKKIEEKLNQEVVEQPKQEKKPKQQVQQPKQQVEQPKQQKQPKQQGEQSKQQVEQSKQQKQPKQQVEQPKQQKQPKQQVEQSKQQKQPKQQVEQPQNQSSQIKTTPSMEEKDIKTPTQEQEHLKEPDILKENLSDKGQELKIERRGEIIRKASEELEKIIADLGKKIGTIDKHHLKKAYHKSRELLDGLTLAKDNYLRDLSHINRSATELNKSFEQQCKTLIKAATPLLEKDLGWGDYLTNLLRSIGNALVKAITFGKNHTFFTLTTSKTLGAAEKAQQELEKVKPEEEEEQPKLGLD